jgi:hypothetical protein
MFSGQQAPGSHGLGNGHAPPVALPPVVAPPLAIAAPPIGAEHT